LHELCQQRFRSSSRKSAVGIPGVGWTILASNHRATGAGPVEAKNSCLSVIRRGICEISYDVVFNKTNGQRP
ncbi:MAG: hypothetical protein QF473_38555, partial [Planctomycetota bacterium]|nr:hypothetical protein [Planctomycetota bacterium]